jgi:alpha-D-ribose 1-methylphosphonate 5-triphosphate synthase subunit PhnH
VIGLRRNPRQSQRDFRVLLDVLARPGTTGRLAVTDGVPAATIPVAGLADVEVPLAVLADAGDERWIRPLYVVTGAPAAEPAAARLVLALRPPSAAEIAVLPRGDALNPERGARLVIAVAGLADGQGGSELLLSGPGVQGERLITVRGLPRETIAALAEANAAFPAGVDTFLVAPDGAVAGLPRTTRITTRTSTGAH